jgi:hypothetical protein
MRSHNNMLYFTDSPSLATQTTIHFGMEMYVYKLSYGKLGKGLLEKLTGLQLVKKFSAFYVIQRFISVFTTARKLSLS